MNQMTLHYRNQRLISDHALQQAIGWIALLMPFTVRALARQFDGIEWTNSISAYYYTDLRDVFASSLVVGGLVLAFFRTGHSRDRWVAIVAGIACIGIGLFPMEIDNNVIRSTSAHDEDAMIAVLQHGTHGLIGYHMYFVCTFFALAWYLVTFRFRANTPANPSRQKLSRNLVYSICGGLMAIGFIWIGIYKLMDIEFSIFLPEGLAVMAFAVAWLVKGQAVLKDKDVPALLPAGELSADMA